METFVKETTITPIGVVFMLVMCVLTVAAPRRYSILGVLCSVCYITIGQSIVVANLTFTVFRIVILACWVRLIVRRELDPIGFNTIDKVVTAWIVISVAINVISRGTVAALINRMGFAYDAAGLYFFFRYAIRDVDDVVRTAKLLALLMIPVAVFMIIEKVTGRNMFSIFGGVPEMTQIRGSTLRCQGSFRHPILSGTFGATLAPLFLGLWRINRRTAIMGLLASSVVVITSGSGGPLSTWMTGILGFAAWRVRPYMRAVRWVMLFLFAYMAFFMTAPIWYLTAKISSFAGGTGYHRALLMEQAAKYINEWWLYGTDYTAHWMPYVLPINPNMVDITNQYLAQGVNAGLASMILFIWYIVVSFRKVGQTINLMEDDDSPVENQIAVWAVGTVLLCHATAFIGVAYFDQLEAVFFLTVATIASAFSAVAGLRQPREAYVTGL